MQLKNREIFTTVRIEGGILPPETLQRIIENDNTLGGLDPGNYHLIRGERLNEVINRSWNRLLNAWTSFKSGLEKLPSDEIATTLTRERWLLVLFRELGYGRLLPSKGIEIEGKRYPLSHFWNHVPIHLVGYRVEIDRRTAGVAGAARMSPHSMVQELLNRKKEYLWGMVSNGRILRVLRDNISLTKLSYIEFDLESMMEGEVYSDFVLLWLLCHESRVESERPEECWLEKWSQAAKEQGTRALDKIREGVELAITALGRGFISHQGNVELKDKLRNGILSGMDYYRQLLRLVYRLIFLFAAEDRDILLEPEKPAEAKQRYNNYYSTRKLRSLAEKRRGSKHSDLYIGLRLVMQKLYSGCPELALPALGGFLWSEEAVCDIINCEISNRDLLEAVRSLSYISSNNVRRQIDYKNLGTEELGSIYESLLELHPVLNLSADTFELSTAGGNERKTTGSFYTPSSLINSLLDTALDPVLDEACKHEDPEQAVLNIKVCDPACGSGHFLIAAAHRIAKRLAIIRSGYDEPIPKVQRKALRDVISNCIYGVDVNEMAVELTKISLWMESLEPGKPLSFLDHHIQCVNSLLGTIPDLMKSGIPDDAFTPIEGDDRRVCSDYKRHNREEREGQISWTAVNSEFWSNMEEVASEWGYLELTDDDTIEDIHDKKKKYEQIINSREYKIQKFAADTWCAAFVCSKTRNDEVITHNVFEAATKGSEYVDSKIKHTVNLLASQYKFFHWHLAFPDVFQSYNKVGFDVVLGNPPWEKIKLQKKEWFAKRVPEIANARNASERKHLISILEKEDPFLYSAFLADKRVAEGTSQFVRNSGAYPLCGRGDINTYSVFTELMNRIKSTYGYVGCIVPTGIATDDTTKYFFQSLIDKNSLISLYDFENRQGIFEGVHRSYKFCLLTIGSSNKNTKREIEFMFFGQNINDLMNDEKKFTLNSEEISLINPNTRTCPIFRNKRDARIAAEVYKSTSILKSDEGKKDSGWGIEFLRMFDMSNDSRLFKMKSRLVSEGYKLEGNKFVKDKEVWLPLYESKMFHHYNHRFGTYEGVPENSTSTNLPTPSLSLLKNPNYFVLPRYWVEYRHAAKYLHDAPRELVQAYFNDKHDEAYENISLWITGFYSNRGMDVPVLSKRNKYLRNVSNAHLDKAKQMEREYTLEQEEVIDLENSESLPESIYKVIEKRKYKWLLPFRNIARNTDERTFICTAIPATAVGNSAPIIVTKRNDSKMSYCLLLNLNSLVFDFITRLKAGGINMNFFIVKQLPVLSVNQYIKYTINNLPAIDWLRDRAGALVCNAYDMAGFADDIDYKAPNYAWDEEQRFQLKCEVDAAYFKMYGIDRADVEYILDTFPIIKAKDEEQYGNYRTKDTILQYYDRILVRGN
jgi:hypothetical protein